MELVWKCDYCDEVDNSQLNLHEHEINCFKNPIRKTCWSCRNKIVPVDYFMLECKIGENCSIHDNFACDFWIAKQI